MNKLLTGLLIFTIIQTIYWIFVFFRDKNKAARMIGMDCWSNCNTNSYNTKKR